MALIEKDVKTIEELKTVIGHGGKAAVLYDVSNGEPYGLDVEVLIAMDASIGNKVDKVAGKSLIADTEIARLSGVTNQTLGGLGGEAAANKQDSLAVDGHGVKFPTVDAVNLGLATKPAKTVQVVAGAGLTGGGTLESDRTLNVVSANDGITVNADNIQLNTVDALNSVSTTRPLAANQGKVLNDGKVDKVTGKGLSAEDYTTGEKAKVANVPLNTNTELAAKVDKVAGKSLILDTEIARLATVTNQTKQTLGLENVDNTSDAAKPISTATQTALNGKVNTTDVEQVRSQATNKVASSKLLDDELTALENSVDADIRLLENVINSANINQETTATVTGVDTVALPKTAANTGMSVQLFGQSAQNLVVNGDFRNGTTEWSGIGASISVANSILSVLGSGSSTNPRVVQGGNLTAGNVFYAAIRVRVTNNVCSYLRLGHASSFSLFALKQFPVQNEWYDLSGRGVVEGGADTRLMIRSDYSTAEIAIGKVMEVDYAYAINLTATFGAGNEPTKEQCDLLFANYFEGNDNVLGTGRIRSVNSAGLLPSYLYFNGGQLRSNGLIKDEIRKGTNGYELVKRVGEGTLVEKFPLPILLQNWTPINGGVGNNNILTTSVGSGGVFNNTVVITGKWYKAVMIGNTTATSFRIQNSFNTDVYLSAATGNFNSIVYFKASHTSIHLRNVGVGVTTISSISLKEVTAAEAIAATPTFLEVGANVLFTLATPVITPIQHAGLLNSNSNGTVYFEPIIADAGVYASNLAIQLTDYPIASFESIRKYANGTYTELNTATAVIASGGLSFTHPDLVSGDLVMFTYAYNKESIGRSMTLTHYDSRFVEADTANGKVYRIVPVVTNGVVSWTAVEV